jgi:hypothetical protein
VKDPITSNPGYEIDLTIYSVENKDKMYTDDSYMTEFVMDDSFNTLKD